MARTTYLHRGFDDPLSALCVSAQKSKGKGHSCPLPNNAPPPQAARLRDDQGLWNAAVLSPPSAQPFVVNPTIERPPLTLLPMPLAVLALPPLTLLATALAVLLWPPLTLLWLLVAVLPKQAVYLRRKDLPRRRQRPARHWNSRSLASPLYQIIDGRLPLWLLALEELAKHCEWYSPLLQGLIVKFSETVKRTTALPVMFADVQPAAPPHEVGGQLARG